MAKQDKDNLSALEALMAQLLGQLPPVEITSVKYSPSGRSFVAYDAEGNAFGGDIQRDDVKDGEDFILEQVKSGALGRHFAQYDACPQDILDERMGRFSDWKDIYKA